MISQLNHVKSLQKIASIQVAHLCKNDLFNLDRLYARQLIHRPLWEQMARYFDLKLPSCNYHQPYTYFSECKFCHMISFHYQRDMVCTKTVVGNSLAYSPAGTEGYLEYRCVNTGN